MSDLDAGQGDHHHRWQAASVYRQVVPWPVAFFAASRLGIAGEREAAARTF
ncbi:hypothetical protein STENM327S_03604 [Streptomyces tendae]